MAYCKPDAQASVDSDVNVPQDTGAQHTEVQQQSMLMRVVLRPSQQLCYS